MSTAADNRSITYSAEMAARDGSIYCQVIRLHDENVGRVEYIVMLRNNTGAQTSVSAYVPDPLDLHHRRVVQSAVRPYSSFSTTVELAFDRYGGIPELHVEVSGVDIDFALIVPATLAKGLALDTAAEQQRAVLAAVASPNGASARNGALTALPASRDGGTQVPERVLQVAREGPPGQPPPRRTVESSDAGGVARLKVRRSPAAVPLFVLFVAIMAAIALAAALPHVRELRIPQRPLAAESIPISYRATGIGTVTYAVVGPDGGPFSDGSLATGSGTFSVRFPRTGDDRAYHIRVGIRGPIGSAIAEDYVRIPALRTRMGGPTKRVPRSSAPIVIAPPQIRSLAIDPGMLSGGGTLNVYYDVAATSGTVALIDAGSQIAYGKSQLSPTGHTAFVLPAVETQRFFSIVLTARRGATTTESRVAVTAAPESSPTPAVNGADSSVDVPTVNVPAIGVPKFVRSGQPIQIDIRNNVRGLVLALSDADGGELARRDIGLTRKSTAFTAPIVTSPKQLRVQATYPQGAGSETIVQTIVVRPR